MTGDLFQRYDRAIEELERAAPVSRPAKVKRAARRRTSSGVGYRLESWEMGGKKRRRPASRMSVEERMREDDAEILSHHDTLADARRAQDDAPRIAGRTVMIVRGDGRLITFKDAGLLSSWDWNQKVMNGENP